MARATRRRRPGRSLTSGCINSVELSSTKMRYAVVLVVDMKILYTFNKSDDNIKCMLIVGRRQCGRQEQVGGEAQGGRWHKDVSHWLEFSSTKM